MNNLGFWRWGGALTRRYNGHLRVWGAAPSLPLNPVKPRGKKMHFSVNRCTGEIPRFEIFCKNREATEIHCIDESCLDRASTSVFLWLSPNFFQSFSIFLSLQCFNNHYLQTSSSQRTLQGPCRFLSPWSLNGGRLSFEGII